MTLSRRMFAGAATAALLLPAAARAAGRVKITEVKRLTLKVIRLVGTYPDFLNRPQVVNIGGSAFVEVHTDQGITGIGPDIDPSLLPAVNAILKGQDSFDINLLAARLYNLPTGDNIVAMPVKFRGSASVEVAVWDLIGKIAQQPLYKLWGRRARPHNTLCQHVAAFDARRARPAGGPPQGGGLEGVQGARRL